MRVRRALSRTPHRNRDRKMGLRGKASSLMNAHVPCARMRRVMSVAMLLVAAASVLVLPAIAGAAEGSVPATRTAVTTVTIEGYDVDFTLPTAAKNGCLVCHGDPNLSRLKDGEYVSFFVDPLLVEQSAHAGVQCTGCHLDFAFTIPHVAADADWRDVAKSACQNCHQEQFLAYGSSVHRIESADNTPTADGIVRPMCGDCHGNHGIQTLTDSPEGQQALRERAYDVCGSCHQEYWDNYRDYYHGAAFQEGAQDAPACWDCHRGHEVLPASDRNSSTNERHLVETCAQCHPDATEDYVVYAPMIHHRDEIAGSVRLHALWVWIGSIFGRLLGG